MPSALDSPGGSGSVRGDRAPDIRDLPEDLALNRPFAALALAAPALAALLVLPLAAQPPATPALKTTELGRGPAVVLVHGLGGARMQWMPTARKLLGSYRVVMVDLPGHGDSPLGDGFTLESGAAAVAQVLARQKAESTIVVGQGVGGAIAVLAAHANPGRVRGVVAIDASLKTPFAQVPDQQRQGFLGWLDAASPEEYGAFLKQLYATQGRDSAQIVELQSRAAMVAPTTMKAYFRQLMYFDASPKMKEFRTPLLYIGSSKSWADTVTWASLARERGYEHAAGVATERIGNSGMLIASDQPDSLASAIDAFAKKVIAGK